MRLVHGQRTDLKLLSDKIKIGISNIEEYYHLAIFENTVRKILGDNDFFCVNLKKMNGKNIECGDIDALAYSSSLNKLLIVESKSLAISRDAKAMGKIISDHFKQKKYHAKFLRKIEWVYNNMPDIMGLFSKDFDVKIKEDVSIEAFFVTRNENIIKFMVNEYKATSLATFDLLLKLGNEKRL